MNAENENHEDHTGHYIKIWAILMVLLVVSVCGPMVGNKWLTLATAFGIAIVKAFMVVKNFMHAHLEHKYIMYILFSMVAFMFVFFFGVAPDVMQSEGTNWRKLPIELSTGSTGEH